MSGESALQRFGLYARTVRHLRPVQLVDRVLRSLHRPAVRRWSAPAVRARNAQPVASFARTASYVDPHHVRFVGATRELLFPGVWNDAGNAKLWTYQIHYFDDLHAADAASRSRWHSELISRWIADNPPGVSPAWDAYPTSLRICNWILWHLRGNALDSAALESLATQAEWLSRRLEFHLLGNHLLENYRALWLAGTFFDIAAAKRWRQLGADGLQEQLRRQVLADGGHEERSPMYQALLLGGLLDLVNVLAACGEPIEAWLRDTCSRMLDWLETMTHPDGDIVLFNDAAFDAAPLAADLRAYAQRLDVAGAAPEPAGLVHLQPSGYVRWRCGETAVFLDIAAIGPDHQPAHGHADTFTYEVSHRGRRLFVDTGCSTYEPGVERLFQRSTAAHNTLQVDGRDSSEVWAAFRVARRARVSDVRVMEEHGQVRISAAHDGYRHLAGRPTHVRAWELGARGIAYTDTLRSSASHEVRGCMLLHEEISVTPAHAGQFELVHREAGHLATVQCDASAQSHVEPALYHPRFGQSLASHRIVTRARLDRGGTLRTEIRWR